MPRVSVIVPNYNHKAYLVRRIESILNQSFQDFELILLDDFSIDGSTEVLKQYRDHSKVSHLVLNKQNSGSTFAQWQKGIALAKGDFIWIAESDDLSHQDFLMTLMSSFKNNVILSYCESMIIDENDLELNTKDWKHNLSDSKWKESYINQGTKEISEALRFRNTIPNASAVIFRKDVLSEVLIPEDKVFCGDWLFWLRIMEKGDIAFCHLKLNYFRKHSMTTRVSKSVTNELVRHKEYFEIIKHYNGFWSRLKNTWKFDWILNNWIQNKSTMSKVIFFNPPFPIELKLRFLSKYSKVFIRAKLFNRS